MLELYEVPLNINAISEEHLNAPLGQLGLGVRAHMCLKHSGFNTVRKVLESTDAELLSIKNFGRKALRETKEALRNHLISYVGPIKPRVDIEAELKELRKDIDDLYERSDEFNTRIEDLEYEVL